MEDIIVHPLNPIDIEKYLRKTDWTILKYHHDKKREGI